MSTAYGERFDKSHSLLADEFGRFKIWAGNCGALHPATSTLSLDYRLREAPNAKLKVLELLDKLKGQLTECLLEIINPPVNIQDNYVSDEDIDSDDPDGILAQLDLDPKSELEHKCFAIHNSVTHLYRLLVVVRRPVPKNKFKKYQAIDVSAYKAWDISHVANKFPFATNTLVQRLGNANSERRQFFIYQKNHHRKIAEEIDIDDEGLVERAKTVTTETTLVDADNANGTVGNDGLVGNCEGTSSDDGCSQTSFATSVALNENETELKVPPPPNAAQVFNGSFECPYCFKIITVVNARSWRKHVFEDLRPYICTFDDCPIAGTLFSSRREWFNHEVAFHRQEWYCRECNFLASKQESMDQHLQQIHSDIYTQSLATVILKQCQRPIQTPQKCPICTQGLALVQLRKHLAKHMQQLSLFVLPSLDESLYAHAESEMSLLSGNSNSIVSTVRITRSRADDGRVAQGMPDQDVMLGTLPDISPLAIEDSSQSNWTSSASVADATTDERFGLHAEHGESSTGPEREYNIDRSGESRSSPFNQEENAREEMPNVNNPTPRHSTQNAVHTSPHLPDDGLPRTTHALFGGSAESHAAIDPPGISLPTGHQLADIATVMRRHSNPPPYIHTLSDAATAPALATPQAQATLSHVCHKCQRQFVSAWRLQVHMQTHTYNELYTCGTCERQFRTNFNLQRHQRDAHGHMLSQANRMQPQAPAAGRGASPPLYPKPKSDSKEDNTSSHVCPECQREFMSAWGLQDHMRTHTPKELFPCDICGFQYGRQSDLTWHKKAKHNHMPPQAHLTKSQACLRGASSPLYPEPKPESEEVDDFSEVEDAGEYDDEYSGEEQISEIQLRRGRAAPPGRYHRAEATGWRRGPDGVRKLYNECGLHYAQLAPTRNTLYDSYIPIKWYGANTEDKKSVASQQRSNAKSKEDAVPEEGGWGSLMEARAKKARNSETEVAFPVKSLHTAPNLIQHLVLPEDQDFEFQSSPAIANAPVLFNDTGGTSNLLKPRFNDGPFEAGAKGLQERQLESASHSISQPPQLDCPHPECPRKGSKGFRKKNTMRMHIRKVHKGWLPGSNAKSKEDAVPDTDEAKQASNSETQIPPDFLKSEFNVGPLEANRKGSWSRRRIPSHSLDNAFIVHTENAPEKGPSLSTQSALSQTTAMVQPRDLNDMNQAPPNFPELTWEDWDSYY